MPLGNCCFAEPRARQYRESQYGVCAAYHKHALPPQRLISKIDPLIDHYDSKTKRCDVEVDFAEYCSYTGVKPHAVDGLVSKHQVRGA